MSLKERIDLAAESRRKRPQWMKTQSRYPTLSSENGALPTSLESWRLARCEEALRRIATMECFTRAGEEPIHMLMMRIASDALERESIDQLYRHWAQRAMNAEQQLQEIRAYAIVKAVDKKPGECRLCGSIWNPHAPATCWAYEHHADDCPLGKRPA